VIEKNSLNGFDDFDEELELRENVRARLLRQKKSPRLVNVDNP
jgi:hypothetical protein